MSISQDKVDSLVPIVVATYDELRDIRNDAVDMLVDQGFLGVNKTVTIRNLIDYLLSLLDIELTVVVRIYEHLHLTDKITLPSIPAKIKDFISICDSYKIIFPERITSILNDLITQIDSAKGSLDAERYGDQASTSDFADVLVLEAVKSIPQNIITNQDNCLVVPRFFDPVGYDETYTIVPENLFTIGVGVPVDSNLARIYGNDILKDYARVTIKTITMIFRHGTAANNQAYATTVTIANTPTGITNLENILSISSDTTTAGTFTLSVLTTSAGHINTIQINGRPGTSASNYYWGGIVPLQAIVNVIVQPFFTII